MAVVASALVMGRRFLMMVQAKLMESNKAPRMLSFDEDISTNLLVACEATPNEIANISVAKYSAVLWRAEVKRTAKKSSSNRPELLRASWPKSLSSNTAHTISIQQTKKKKMMVPCLAAFSLVVKRSSVSLGSLGKFMARVLSISAKVSVACQEL